jgi:hypothetical protein
MFVRRLHCGGMSKRFRTCSLDQLFLLPPRLRHRWIEFARIEQATYDDVAFHYLAADQHPDHDTIASFRQQHLESLGRLFVQALRLCQKAGLVKLGHVAMDGTKLEVNASGRQSMSYDKLTEQEQYWKQKVLPASLAASDRLRVNHTGDSLLRKSGWRGYNSVLAGCSKF